MEKHFKKVTATFLISTALVAPTTFGNSLNNRALDAIASSLAATTTLNDNDGVGNGVALPILETDRLRLVGHHTLNGVFSI